MNEEQLKGRRTRFFAKLETMDLAPSYAKQVRKRKNLADYYVDTRKRID